MNKDKIIVCGDIHGKFREFVYKMTQIYKIENAIICCVGDIGMGFHKPNYYKTEFTRMSKALKKNNNMCFFVRGNHDDPEYFNGKHKDSLNIFENIKLVSDYELINTELGNILFIGGGTSIDRTKRIVNETYWENEKCIFDEEKINSFKDITNIDYVITHTAPSFCYPQTKDGIKYWILKDSKLDEDLNEERQTMDKIFKLLEENNVIKYWAYGHFHCFLKQRCHGVNFVVCDELNFYMLE